MQRDVGLFFKFFLFRLLLSWLIAFPEHPDEYWQSQEPAYRFVYGRGSLTYEWDIGMRSYVFLLPYIAGMALAKCASMLESHLGPFAFLARGLEDWLLWHWKWIVASLTAATIDLYTLKLARKVLAPGGILDRWVLLVMFTNSTLIRSLVRPYSNCTEAMLSLVALHLWPMKAADWSRKKFGVALLVIGWAALVRISALQGWILPGLAVLSFAPLSGVLSILVPAIGVVLAFGLVVDRIGYGRWVVSVWNFVYWNVLKGVAAEHGVHPLALYFNHLATATLSSSLLFFGIGLWQAARRAQASREPLLFPLTHFALPTLVCLSAVGHKEVRFMFPVIPVLLMYCAYGLQQTHLFTQKRHYLLKCLFWMGVILCTGQQLHRGFLPIRQSFINLRKAVLDIRDILEHDTSLDRSERCNGGVSIFIDSCRGPGMGLLNRLVPFEVMLTFPLAVMPYIGHRKYAKEYGIFAQSNRLELIFRNMQIRDLMPAVLVLSSSHFSSNEALLEVLEAAGYRECGVVELKYSPVHIALSRLFGPRAGSLKTEKDLIDGLIFCKRYDTLIPNNYLSVPNI